MRSSGMSRMTLRSESLLRRPLCRLAKVADKQSNVGRSNAGDAAGLPDGGRANAAELFLTFVAEPLEDEVIERVGDGEFFEPF